MCHGHIHTYTHTCQQSQSMSLLTTCVMGTYIHKHTHTCQQSQSTTCVMDTYIHIHIHANNHSPCPSHYMCHVKLADTYTRIQIHLNTHSPCPSRSHVIHAHDKLADKYIHTHSRSLSACPRLSTCVMSRLQTHTHIYTYIGTLTVHVRLAQVHSMCHDTFGGQKAM